MRQKKMLSEEEKRRCVHLIVNMVFKSPHQGWQILLNRFFISGVWKGWRRQPALCRVSRWQSLKPFLGFWNNCLLKNEDLKVAELAADNPRLLHAKKLLYTVSRYSEIILLKYQFWYRISYLFILPSIQIDSGLESEGRPSEGLCGEPTEGRCQSVWLLWKWWKGGWWGPRWHVIFFVIYMSWCNCSMRTVLYLQQDIINNG